MVSLSPKPAFSKAVSEKCHLQGAYKRYQCGLEFPEKLYFKNKISDGV
jgi:hypothetical protein